MLSLRAHRLSFAYSGRPPVFADVDLHLVPSWIGVVGPNGAGKTTFLRLLTGELEPESGSLLIEPEGVRAVHCPQTVEQLTPEIVEFAQAKSGAARRIQGQLRLVPAEIERWPTLSPGERKRWQIGAALAEDPPILLLDEPTNHIDAEARELLLRALHGFHGIGLLVSHDRTLLNALSTSTLRFDKGTAQLYSGGYSDAKKTWEAEEQGLLDAHQRVREKERKLRRRLGDARRVHAEADAARNAGNRMKSPRDSDGRGMMANYRASTAEASLSRALGAVRHKLDVVASEAASFQFEKERGRPFFVDYVRSTAPFVFVIDAPEIRAGSAKILGDVRLSVRREDRIRIEGPNGGGKTTLVKALLSHARIPEHRMLYVPQEISAEEERALLARVRALPAEERGRVLSLVAALGVSPERLLASESPSPGEARKLSIALGLGRHVWALILDEPTNHMDLPSIERLERALTDYPGALLLVTHDKEFARRCTSTVWRVEGGEVLVSADENPAGEAVGARRKAGGAA